MKTKTGKRLIATADPNDIQRKFDETRAAEAKRIAGKPGVRLDYRTGQYVPTIDGKDTSPTSFDEKRALDIAQQTCEREANKKHVATPADRAKDPYLSEDSIVYDAETQPAKHTPGPWGRNIRPASKYPIVFAGRNTHVAQIISRQLPESEIEANCDLIAAAPELLEVCKAALDGLYSYRDIEGNCSAMSEREKLRAAIAKAEGREL